MVNYVLDASALLALFHGEPGNEKVIQAIKEGAAMSAVNLAEVTSKLNDQKIPEAIVQDVIGILPLTIVDFHVEFAHKVGLLRSPTKHAGLALGDRACLALAMHLQVPAITADRVWEKLSLDITIQVLR